MMEQEATDSDIERMIKEELEEVRLALKYIVVMK